MNVTVLSRFDQAGGSGRLALAINEMIGHEARALSWAKKRSWPWPCIHRPTRQQTVEAIRWADALVVIGNRLPVVKGQVNRKAMFPEGSPERPTVVNYRGSIYLENIEYFNEMDERDGVIQSGNFCDLLAVGGLPHWLPNPLWADEVTCYRDREQDDVFRVIHSIITPNRLGLKGSPETKRRLTGLEGVEYEVITRLPYQVALERMGRRADLVVTAFTVGYGNAGIEAMCMGIPVIAWGPPEYLEEVERRVGYLPFVACPLERLRETVDSLRNDRDQYLHYAKLGPQYVQDFHAPQVVADKAIELCRLAGAE